MIDFILILIICLISFFMSFNLSLLISIGFAIFSMYFHLLANNISIENILTYQFTYSKLFEMFFPPISFVFVAYFSSFFATKRRMEIKYLKKEIEKLKKNHQELIEKFKKVEEARVILEKKFLRDEDFSLKLYDAISSLSKLGYEEIKIELLKITHEFINAKALAFYDFNNGKFYIKDKFPENYNFPELIDSTNEIYKDLINSENVLTVKDKLKNNKSHILMASLLRKKDKDIIGAILIFDIDFLDMNATNVRLFNMICNWGSIEIEKAIHLAMYEAEHIKFGGKDIFNYMYFLKIVNAEHYKVKRYDYSFSILVVKIVDFEQIVPENLTIIIEKIGVELKKRLRICDLIFYNDVTQDSFIIILPETDLKGAKTVGKFIKQFSKEAKIYPYYNKEKILEIEISTFYVNKEVSDEEFSHFLLSLIA